MTESLPLSAKPLIDESTAFNLVAAEWLAHAEPQLRGAFKTYKLYVKTHFAPFFQTIGGFTDEMCSRYVSHRLRSVQRSTLQKELSALRWLGDWCEEQKIMTRAPRVPKPRRGAVGTRHWPDRRSGSAEFARDEIELVMAALPEWSESKRVARFPIRSRFVVAMETGLRPSTLDRLEAPTDYAHGATVLRLRDEADKNFYGRELPLTERARAALDSVCPKSGLIFGRHDYRDALGRAAAVALPPNRAEEFTAYVLRHARLTEFAETGNLVGAAFLAGHRQVTTINRYAKPNRRAAELVLKAVEKRADPTLAAPPLPAPRALPSALAVDGTTNERTAEPHAERRRATPTARRSAQPQWDPDLLAVVVKSWISKTYGTECEGEDLNLHGNNPASTSS